MRALLMLLAILMLEGCIATASLQRETTQAAQLAARQCSQTQVQVSTLIAAQEKTTQAIEREAKARRVINTPVQKDQSCAELRKSLSNKTIVGAVEWARVDLGSHQMIAKARMDTGASTSSISARNIAEFERNGKRWVRFTLSDGKEVSLILERFANIRQASAEKDKRRVVKLGVKLGDISQIAEFTLKDRHHLNYEILIGRNLLRDLAVVDVARRYVLGGKPKSATTAPRK